MTPEELLREMCLRHGLPTHYGDQLIPVVRRALDAPSALRKRILTLVESNLARKAEGTLDNSKLWQDLDNSVLAAVARVLHDWTPSSSVLDLGRRLDGLSGDSADPAA